MTKIDRKDIKILQALDKNPRMSFTQIGKQANLGKETVQYRFNRLIKENVIKGFWMVPRIDSKSSAYKVLLRSKGVSSESFEEIKNFLIRSDVVSWIAICNGYWNLHLTLISDNDSNILSLLRELFTTYSHLFIDIQFHKSVKVYSFNEKYLYEKPFLNSYEGSFLDKPSYADETNKKILDILSNNARESFTEIGNKLNLTPEAILLRFKKIKYHIGMLKPRINHQKLGLAYYHLWLRLTDGKFMDQIISYCKSDKNSVFIMEHVGKYHLHIELVSKEDQMEEYLGNLMKKFEKAILEYDLCKIVSELKIKIKQ